VDRELTRHQRAVLLAFYEYGAMTDVALTTYVHHTAEVNMSSSGIRTRRAELCRHDPALLQVVGTKIMKSGRRAAIHDLTRSGVLTAAELSREREALNA
jgi:hypothetical protein